MAFIDEINVNLEAGRGGDGVVRWRHEKFIDKGGPNGGDGGHGGDVYALGCRDPFKLAEYRHKKEFKAGRGENGMGGSKHGANGVKLFFELPVGSLITNKQNGNTYELVEEGQKILLLKGGFGGNGNEHYKSSINTTPTKATKGKPGDDADFHIELRLFADMGLVGLPNAGKSSLLNALTNSRAKIGDYAFTTLDPNLGDFYGHIIADIPGVIEGASEGKGLGVKFLRHIMRTKKILHLISFENEIEKGGMMKVYKQIRKELKAYGNGLDEKDEIILLTKTDVVEDGKTKLNTKEKIIAKKVAEFKKLKKPVYTISLYDDKSVKKFSDELVKLIRE